MDGTTNVTPGRLARILLSLLIVLQVGIGTVAASPVAESDQSPVEETTVQTARTIVEMRAQLQVAQNALERGNRSAAVDRATYVADQLWSIVDGPVSEANQTLANRLERTLERAPEKAETLSAGQFSTFLETEVYPQLSDAERAIVGETVVTNATYNARVVKTVLQHGVAEYREAVSENGTVTDRTEYRISRAFLDHASARYRSSIRSALSDHAAEELDELFEMVKSQVNETVPPSTVASTSSSIVAELAEYTGLETESGSASVDAIERIETDLHEALEAYRANNSSKALRIIQQTYLSNFEGVEGTLIEHRPELVESLEVAFNEELPGLIKNDASPAAVREKIESMETKLETAEEILKEANEDPIQLTISNQTTTNSPTTPRTPGDGSDPGQTNTTTPGFGVAVAVAAVFLLAGYGRHRQQ
ncbi:MAG: PGF-CTERM sorting domain-containing protein [Halodesulfurarchaeum sp.]